MMLAHRLVERTERLPYLAAYARVIRICLEQRARCLGLLERQDHRERRAVALHQLALAHVRLALAIDPNVESLGAEPAAKFAQQGPGLGFRPTSHVTAPRKRCTTGGS